MPSSVVYPWIPGEHVCVTGDTGSGKTFLMSQGILRMRRYVVVFRTKKDDDDDTKWRGFRRITKARQITNERYERFLLDPAYSDQARQGYELLERTYKHGRWTVVIDEGFAAEKLGLAPWIERSVTQGRSMSLTIVYGQQRPISPPGGTLSRWMLSQAKHVFAFRAEGRDVKTIVESTSPRLEPFISEQWAERHGDRSHLVPKYGFVYYNRETREVRTGNSRTLGTILRPSGRAADRPDETGAPVPA